MPKMVEPDVGYDDESFWNGVKQGKLLLARCARCSRLQHPPSPMCPHCGSLAWEAQEASGRGTVLSWIVSHHPTKPDDAPRIVALIDLEEGARLVSNLQDVEAADVSNDMAVEVVFREVDGFTLPQFRPTHQGAI
jgi:uncharacterized protein